MTSRLACIAVVGITLLLAGCVAPAEPPGPTDDEVRAYLVDRSAQWWHSISPDDAPPTVPVVRAASSDEQGNLIADCLRINGFRYGFSPQAEEVNSPLMRAQWTCAEQFPATIDDSVRAGVFGKAQLAYLYDYFRRRLIPCLTLDGYTVSALPDRATFLDTSIGRPSWNPYTQLRRAPSDWRPLVARCPPPAFAISIVPEMSGR